MFSAELFRLTADMLRFLLFTGLAALGKNMTADTAPYKTFIIDSLSLPRLLFLCHPVGG